MAKHFDGVIGNSMKNGLQINLKDAIEDAGAKVSSSACLWQYPEIIRNNLVAKTVSGINLLGKDIINVYTSNENGEQTYNISTIFDTSSVQRPKYAENNPAWGSEMSVDNIFSDLFTNILPAIRGIHAGDMTVTDGAGNDTKQWHNTLFNIYGYKSGLLASSKYLRIYLTCQAEPLYIFIDSAVSDLTNGYNVKDSDTVQFELDNTNMTLSAHINCITSEQLNSIY
jgi:hypothetical protein